MNPSRLAACLAVLIAAGPAGAADSGTLIISDWGGSYANAQRIAYIDPFRQLSGLEVQLKNYSGGISPLQSPTAFDVVDMAEFEALAACDEGLLERLDRAAQHWLADAPDTTPALDDFIPESILRCGIAHLEIATVLAYNDRHFSDEKPSSVQDFFDLERFPGKRALHKAPRGLLEWALLSYNFPPGQIYDSLSTERGLRLVSRRLNEIRDSIVWWEDSAQPAEMLQSGEVVMASGYNGVFFNARVNDDIPISVIRDGQLLEFGVWVIPKTASNQEAAREFIRFATRSESMAAMGNLIPYAPTRSSAITRIGLHSEAAISMRSYMPSSASAGALRMNSLWYAQTEDLRDRWFSRWLGQQ